MKEDNQYTLLFLCGGTGTRMGAETPKQFLNFMGKPVLVHTLERIERIDLITNIVIVCAPKYQADIENMLSQYGITKPVRFADAGQTRQASVFSGLKEVHTELMILHEAARPLVKQEDFESFIQFPYKNATFGSSIPYSVIRGHNSVEGILDRSELINVQLPQKFETRLLREAHEKALSEGVTFTEDAGMIARYFPDVEVGICRGPEYDIKLTTPIDMEIGAVLFEHYFKDKK